MSASTTVTSAPASLDSFKCRKTLSVDGQTYVYYSLPDAEKNGLSGISKLPYSIRVLLEGMLAKDRLLDLVENFVLFDESRIGGARKIVARNHQVLGVNSAVASVLHQEDLKKKFPPERRLTYRTATVPLEEIQHEPAHARAELELPIVERAHPDLGRLGVFWHTQGSGKSYSMAFLYDTLSVLPGAKRQENSRSTLKAL